MNMKKFGASVFDGLCLSYQNVFIRINKDILQDP